LHHVEEFRASCQQWCYAAETAADIIQCLLHSALGTSPHFAWYGELPSIHDFCVWGFHHKKADDETVQGLHMGCTKLKTLIQWLDPRTDKVKHSCAVKLKEHHVWITEDENISSGSMLLLDDPPPIDFPIFSIDLSDKPSLHSEPLKAIILLPPSGP